jgi:hypothetical protein
VDRSWIHLWSKFNITNHSYQELLNTIDNERHAWLRAYETPPAMSEWDRWQYPSKQDISRLLDILDGEKQSAEDFHNAHGWATVGTTGLFEFLNDRC